MSKDIGYPNGNKAYSSTTGDVFYDNKQKAYSNTTGDVYYRCGKKAFSSTIKRAYYSNGQTLGSEGINYGDDSVEMQLGKNDYSFQVYLAPGFVLKIENRSYTLFIDGSPAVSR